MTRLTAIYARSGLQYPGEGKSARVKRNRMRPATLTVTFPSQSVAERSQPSLLGAHWRNLQSQSPRQRNLVPEQGLCVSILDHPLIKGVAYERRADLADLWGSQMRHSQSQRRSIRWWTPKETTLCSILFR